MDKNQALELLRVYGEAWVERDADKIITIFTDDATYDDPHEPVAVGRDGIREYWRTKVLGTQQDIDFRVLNSWLDGDSFIAEWEADFTDTARQLRVKLREIAVFTVRGDSFSALREYYKSIKTPL